MSLILRPYQLDVKNKVYENWRRGDRAVMAVMPCGAGKTVLFSDIITEMRVPAIVIAHRAELVSQASLALALNGVRHRIIGPSTLAKEVSGLHTSETGRSYYDPNARVAVAGVDTLVRMPATDPYFSSVQLVVTDECAHLLRDNKWGKSIELFPNARSLGVTATPCRADGYGLGRHADGIFDSMIIGPSMRDLINMGSLCDYRIFAPPSDIDLSNVGIAANGDFSLEPLRKAVHKSHIVGDVVTHYKALADGKLGLTFAVDIEGAIEISQAFNAAGVKAEVISGKTPTHLRMHILRKFKRKEILQLVSCEIFGEGFNLPAVECVSFARPTQSYGLFIQQFGRACRTMEGKTHAIILDHVSNVVRHGLPDKKRNWTLDRRERSSRSKPNDAVPFRVCLNPTCMAPYERTYVCCPYCGHYPEPAGRAAIEQVDGDLVELSAEALAKMRGDVELFDAATVSIPYGAAPEVVGACKKRHREKHEAQASLRETISLWSGLQNALGRTDIQEHYRLFYFTYGIDVLSAQVLGTKDAEDLQAKLLLELTRNNVDAQVNKP